MLEARTCACVCVYVVRVCEVNYLLRIHGGGNVAIHAAVSILCDDPHTATAHAFYWRIVTCTGIRHAVELAQVFVVSQAVPYYRIPSPVFVPARQVSYSHWKLSSMISSHQSTL